MGNTITSITEDNVNLWVGTTGGLISINKTTGQKVIYNKANSDIPFNDFYNMLIDKNGNLWLERYDRIAKFDGQNWTDYNIRNTQAINYNYDYVSLAEDSLGNIWFGTFFDGLLKNDGNGFAIVDSVYYPSLYPNSGKIKLSGVRKMAVDSLGDLWIGENYYVFVLKNDTLIEDTIDPFSNAYPQGDISVFKFDRNAKLWAASYSCYNIFPNSVSYRDHSGWHNLSDTTGLTEHVQDIAVDEFGNVLFATSDTGVVKYDGNNFVSILNRSNSKLKSNNIRVLHFDNNETLWIGTDSGLFKYKNNLVTSINTSLYNLPSENPSLSIIKKDGTKYFSYIVKYSEPNSPAILRMMKTTQTDTTTFSIPYGIGNFCEDSIGNVWAMGWEGIFKIVDTTLQLYKMPLSIDSLIINVFDMTYDKQSHKFWIGADHGKLLSFDGNQWKVEANFFNQWSNLTAVFVDSLGTVWVGTNGRGIYAWSNNQWTTYNYSWILHNEYINIIKEDKNHNVWFSSLDNGMAKYNYNQWQVFNSHNSGLFPYTWINDFAFDRDNKLYVGAGGNGMYIYDGNTWDSINMYNSDLPFRAVNNFHFDTNGNLWMNTNSLNVYNINGVILSSQQIKKIISKKNDFLVFPNPANDKISFISKNFSKNFEIHIYDMQGKSILSRKINNAIGKITLETTNLPNGIYILCVESNGENSYSKFVIQR